MPHLRRRNCLSAILFSDFFSFLIDSRCTKLFWALFFLFFVFRVLVAFGSSADAPACALSLRCSAWKQRLIWGGTWPASQCSILSFHDDLKPFGADEAVSIRSAVTDPESRARSPPARSHPESRQSSFTSRCGFLVSLLGVMTHGQLVGPCLRVEITGCVIRTKDVRTEYRDTDRRERQIAQRELNPDEKQTQIIRINRGNRWHTLVETGWWH
jgi:hypothetical protein